MCTRDDPAENQQGEQGGPRSNLLQELIQMREQVTAAGYGEAAHFLDVAAAALEEAIDRDQPSKSLQKGFFDIE